jgi:serine protease Do
MDSRAFWLRWKTRGWAYSFSIAATLALGILIGTVVSYGVKGKEGQKSSDATPLTVPSPKQMSNAFSQIAKQLGPSVVNINTESTIKNPHRRRAVPGQGPDDDENGGGGNGGMDDFFNRFFGGQGGPQGDAAIRERSLGSGVVVDGKGYIVTNRHVIDKADRIRVRLQDDPPGVQHDAK